MDGDERKQDTSLKEDSSTKVSGQTSEQTTEAFTREQHETEKQKAVSDALSAAGRTAKALETREAAVRVTEEKATQAQKAKDDAELEAARGDSDEMSRIQTRQQLREAKAKLAKAEQELSEEREKGKQRDAEAAQTTLEVNAWKAAKRLDVDAETLLKLVKFTDGSKEAIEAIGQTLPKKGEAKPPLKTDSGKTIGGGEKSNEQKLKERYPTM